MSHPFHYEEIGLVPGEKEFYFWVHPWLHDDYWMTYEDTIPIVRDYYVWMLKEFTSWDAQIVESEGFGIYVVFEDFKQAAMFKLAYGTTWEG